MKSKMILMALLWPVLAWSGTTGTIAWSAPPMSGPIFMLHATPCDAPACHAIIFQEGGKTIFSIDSSGAVTLGSGVAPDDAARAFWKAVESMAPARCANDRTKPK